MAAAPDALIVHEYANGRASVEDFLNVCRSYQGPVPHFLFSAFYAEQDESYDDYWSVLAECVDETPEDDVIKLLEAVVAETPHVLSLTTNRSLLQLAILGTRSSRVQILLAVPESTCLLDNRGRTPLSVACDSRSPVDASVIHRLIDVDPDALTLPDDRSRVPLHYALERDPSSSYIKKMIDLRPETLFYRNSIQQTPVAEALERWDVLPAAAEAVAVVLSLVQQHPASVALPDTHFICHTPLRAVCVRHADLRPELVRAVLQAYPPPLVIPDLHQNDEMFGPLLRVPYQAGAADAFGGEEALAFVREETVHMALAVVEYVLDMDVEALAARDDVEADNVAWFQQHIKEALQQVVPGVAVAGASGLTVARELLRWCQRSSSGNISALVTALFCDDKTRWLLCDDARRLRRAVLCPTVVDLYRLNRLGRYAPHSTGPTELEAETVSGDESIVSAAAAPLHQIDLLAELRDSSTVESTYLQFRKVSHHALLSSSNGRGLGAGPTTGSSTEGGSAVVVVNSPKNRKRPAPDSDPKT